MGLEFNDNGIIRNLTVADMLTDEFQESYSDLYKSLHGIRPRWYSSPETMLNFFDTYEAEMEAEMERERAAKIARVAYLEDKHGRKFSSYHEADTYNVRQALERYERQFAEEQEAIAAKQQYKEELRRRFSPLAVIRMWEYGLI